MKIIVTSFFLAAALLVDGASSQSLMEDAPLVGLGSLTPLGSTVEDSPAEGRPTAAERRVIEAELVQALEVDEQGTVVGPVEIRELMCESLPAAEDAAMLSFAITSGEIVTAEKLYYAVTSGDIFTDGVARKVWMGTINDPVLVDDEALPRTVSMSWGEECDVETFVLKITKRNTDGTSSITKTVPCGDSPTQTCLVEMLVEFNAPPEATVPARALLADNGYPRASTGTSGEIKGVKNFSQNGGRLRGSSTTAYGGRRLEDDTNTVVDVLVLYSTDALALLGGVTPGYMETTIWQGMVGTNQAFVNSDISLTFNTVHVGPLPYEQNDTTDNTITLSTFRLDEDVTALRDHYGADLVQLIGATSNGSCGFANKYDDGDEDEAFSIANPTCLESFAHTHVFGHNMGCYHNRENTTIFTDYAHGLQYCDGTDRYATVMSCSCSNVSRVNYFSNPNVTYLDKPTGTATDNNARMIKENMVVVSNYRSESTPTPSPTNVLATSVHPAAAPITAEPPTATPTTYSYVGCYSDDAGERVLSGGFVKGEAAMTTEACALFCEGSTFFGTQYSNECFCGPATDEPAALGKATCNRHCSGDDTEMCGGHLALSVYQFDDTYNFVGCYGDKAGNRVLSGDFRMNDSTMTTEVCAEICVGYAFFGTEFGEECFCGVALDDPTELGKSTFCNFECTGDDTETCGGYNAISVYEYPIAKEVATPEYMGCWTDRLDGRIMKRLSKNSDMTKDICEVICRDYEVFGLQYGEECWCGDASANYTVHGESSACDYECPGDDAQTCGGVYSMSVWEYQ